MKKINLNIKGMHCHSCEIIIKDSLEGTDGVISAEVSHAEGTAKVVFDESKIDEDKIKRAIIDEGCKVE